MEHRTRKQLLSQAYEELHARLSAILYEEDPLCVGTSVGFPFAEYNGETARLAASLRQTNGDTRKALLRVFGEGEEALFTDQLPAPVSERRRHSAR